MQQSDQIADLAAALAMAQGAMDHASKDRTNPAFKSRYADLASVVDACRPALSANGIAVLQPARVEWDERGAVVEVETRLVHKSGQWVAEKLCAGVTDAKAQSIGSAITYLRRYGLSAMVGVAPDDDDGQAATRPAREERHEPAPRPQAPALAPAPQDAPTITPPPAAAPRRTPQQVCAAMVTQIIDAATKAGESHVPELDKLIGSGPDTLTDKAAIALLGTQAAPGPLRALRDTWTTPATPAPSRIDTGKATGRIAAVLSAIRRDFPARAAEAEALAKEYGSLAALGPADLAALTSALEGIYAAATEAA